MAFKLYLYQGLWQHHAYFKGKTISCEWLSNCIFIRVFDNRAAIVQGKVFVVNGFQIVSLSGSLTTRENRRKTWSSCEWLSNCIFIRVFDNATFTLPAIAQVVNGFQIVSLSGSLTTANQWLTVFLWLWMAFKLYLYQGLWQRKWHDAGCSDCCEWLSNCIFIRVFDNAHARIYWVAWVVNGFQIVSLSGSLTTNWQ